MKDYQKKIEEACNKLRKQTPTAMRANPSIKSMANARAAEEDKLLTMEGYFDCPYNVQLSDVWWFY
mgnify:CR=1 FL=1